MPFLPIPLPHPASFSLSKVKFCTNQRLKTQAIFSGDRSRVPEGTGRQPGTERGGVGQIGNTQSCLVEVGFLGGDTLGVLDF